MLKRLLGTILPCLLVVTCQSATNAPETDVLQTLRPAHPRLLVLDAQLEASRKMIQGDPALRALHQRLQSDAEQLLAERPLQYKIGGVEHTLLDVSRTMESRVLLLAGLYRLDGDRRFAVRAREEMLSAASFPDWFPKHFLDTGEMTATLGIGYDWLFDFLSPEDRRTIRQAIIDKGLKPGIAGLSGNGRLTRLHNNWVQVCNGGLTIGALAIAEDDRADAAEIIRLAQPQMAKIMALFAPDGGFEEGPGYWNYATIYNVLYLASLDSALGTDFGLSQAPGFALTGNYRMQTIGPISRTANFGDAAEGAGSAPQMLWLGQKFNHPEYLAHEHEVSGLSLLDPKREKTERFAILQLLWDKSGGPGLANTPLPAGAKFDRIACAFFRSAWGDTNAFYVAFKGGSNHASHGHLDLGTFILDAFGERWALDLGADSYGLPGYFGAERWTYYRARTEGHNTLTVDGQNEDLQAAAPLKTFHSDNDQAFAIADLAAAYPKSLANWQRGIRLLAGRAVLVQDEVEPKSTADLTWNFHTRAEIDISSAGTEAMLRQGHSKLKVKLLSPSGGKFEDLPVTVPEPQKPVSGVHDLVVRLPRCSVRTTIAVLFQGAEDSAPPPAPVALGQWK